MMHIRVAASHRIALEQRLAETLDATFPRGLAEPTSIETSPLFPFENDCLKCKGTGEGDTSTFCKSCHGAGRTRVIATMSSGAHSWIYHPQRPIAADKLIVLTEPLPKRFAPYFPPGLVRPRNPVKIVA